ncbi:MAG: adenosylhomocysteinase, partial [Atribacterota bacterium]|nr:adenosylhomocysteinase [Atribacterota bacterium]
MLYDIKDINLAGIGKKRIAWAENQMPVLTKIKNIFTKTKPFKNIKISS